MYNVKGHQKNIGEKAENSIYSLYGYTRHMDIAPLNCALYHFLSFIPSCNTIYLLYSTLVCIGDGAGYDIGSQILS